MPFALVTIGLLLIVTGVKDTYSQFGTLLKGDLTGQNNFTYWLAALGMVGAVGYSDTLRPIANLFLALIIIVMVLKNGNPNGGGGLFDKLKQALQQGPQQINGAQGSNGSDVAKVADTVSAVAPYLAMAA